MKHLVGKPITLSVVENGLLYTIASKYYTVEIYHVGPADYELIIAETSTNTLALDTLVFDNLLTAVSNADEIIDELLTEELPLE